MIGNMAWKYGRQNCLNKFPVRGKYFRHTNNRNMQGE